MLADMDEQGAMRAADSDRQAVAERLRVALDEGRLDLHEYDERLQRAYAARTYAELDTLVSDLPAPAGAVAPTSVAPTPAVPDAPVPTRAGRGPTAQWLAMIWGPWLQAVGIVVTVWAVTSMAAGVALYFWPGWVAGPWGAVLLVRTVTGLASGEPERWAAQRERRRQRRAQKRALKRERRMLSQRQPDAAGSGGAAAGERAALAVSDGVCGDGRPVAEAAAGDDAADGTGTGEVAGAPAGEARRSDRGDVG